MTLWSFPNFQETFFSSSFHFIYCCCMVKSTTIKNASIWCHRKNNNKTNTKYLKDKVNYYSLNKKEWISSLFKEWILEKSEIRVNLEWTFVLFSHFGVTTGITQGFRVIPEVTPKWVNNTNFHSKFTPISLFSKIHSLKSEHIYSFLFREYIRGSCHAGGFPR